ncbi:hypothetical protein HHI36_024267 [Cryptolaemus montrouzieri]|uniref:Mutator-like transposase domain-containing protein n=1 Tax=Cryptolaemus montrouzieri TaxID=559131 RepID=A0ABD2NBX8_9CUCU
MNTISRQRRRRQFSVPFPASVRELSTTNVGKILGLDSKNQNDISNSFRDIGTRTRPECGKNTILQESSFSEAITNSPKVSVPSRTGRSQEVYDVNVLLVYGKRSKGKAMSAAKEFSAVMNMPRPPKFNKYEAILNVASEKMCQEHMDTSKEEAVAQNSGDRDIVAAFDGSWQKRGHTGCFNEN